MIFNVFECKKCGNCCRELPCLLEPEDLPKIAQYLHITEKELINDYLVWHRETLGHYKVAIFLLPMRKDTKETMGNSWVNYSLDCLSDLELPDPILKINIDNINTRIKEGNIPDLPMNYVQHDRYEQSRSPCIFLSDDNLCKIHQVKPVGGKMWKCKQLFQNEQDWKEWEAFFTSKINIIYSKWIEWLQSHRDIISPFTLMTDPQYS